MASSPVHHRGEISEIGPIHRSPRRCTDYHNGNMRPLRDCSEQYSRSHKHEASVLHYPRSSKVHSRVPAQLLSYPSDCSKLFSANNKRCDHERPQYGHHKEYADSTSAGQTATNFHLKA